uniref:Uncharacterized protein n=1 Tax=Rhizophora mucronata TaxID=61149 RepID=A0A2P2Q4W4_RHIMU
MEYDIFLFIYIFPFKTLVN